MSDLPGGQGSADEFDLGEEADGEEEIDVGDEGDQSEGGDGEADEGSAEGADDEGGSEESPRQVGRSGGRRTQAQRLRERLERQDTELAELKRRLDQPAAPQYRQPDPAEIARQQREEQARLEMMSPQEVSAYYYQKGQQEFRQSMMAQQVQLQDQMDKQGFEVAARSSKIHRDYQARVEQMVQAERARGNFATRENVLTFLVGQDAMRRATAAAPRQRQAAASRVRGQQTRPTGARGDAAPGRRPAADSYEAALARISGKPIF